jgi:hypothetical protein
MDNSNLILFVMSGGFTIMFALMVMLWSHMNKSLDKIDNKIDQLGEKIHGLDTRLSRIEGILHSQDCCVIKEDRSLRKAE